MKKYCKYILMLGLINPCTLYANDGPDAGFVLNGKMVDLVDAENQQLEHVEDITQVEGYSEVVVPILNRLRLVAPVFKIHIEHSLKNKSWFFVGKLNAGDDSVRGLKRVGYQNDSSVKLYKPWFSQVEVKQKGVLILHEMLIAHARRITFKDEYEKDVSHGPSQKDVENLVSMLVHVENMSNASLNSFVREYNFDKHRTYFFGLKEVGKINYKPLGRPFSYGELSQRGYSLESAKVISGNFNSPYNPRRVHNGRVIVFKNVYKDGLPIYFDSIYPKNDLGDVCDDLLLKPSSASSSFPLLAWTSDKTDRREGWSPLEKLNTITCKLPSEEDIYFELNENNEVVLF